jgi:hypothetical protein
MEERNKGNKEADCSKKTELYGDFLVNGNYFLKNLKIEFNFKVNPRF